MTMCYIFTRCKNGKYYRGLTYWAENKKDWFICFDDRDPIELVIRHPEIWGMKGKTKYEYLTSIAEKILSNLDFPSHRLGKFHTSNRMIGRSACWFIRSTQDYAPFTPFPTPRKWDEWDKVYDEKPKYEGVYF